MGSLLIIYHYLTSKKTSRDKSGKLVVYLSIAVIGSDVVALGFLGGGDCRAYSCLQAYFILSSVAWSSMLARTISLVRVNRTNLSQVLTRLNSNPFNIRDIERMRMIALHVIAWGVPLLISIAISVVSIDAPMNDWCWFNYKEGDGTVADTSNTALLILFYLPLLFSLCYNTFVLSGLGMKRFQQFFLGDHGDEALYEQTVHNPLEKQLTRLSEKLRWYVVWACFIMFWLCVAELVNLTHSDQDERDSTAKFGIYVFLITLLRLHGVGNLAIYIRTQFCVQEVGSKGTESTPQLTLEEEGEGEGEMEGNPLYGNGKGSYRPPPVPSAAMEDNPLKQPLGQERSLDR